MSKSDDSKKNMPSTDVAEVCAFLRALVVTQSYNLNAVKKQIEVLEATAQLPVADILMRRGLACAYGSLFEQAIDDLRAALSLRCQNESFVRGKLAQTLTRRNAPGDADEAIKLCSPIIEDKSADSDSRWLAAQVTAVACLALGKMEKAAQAATQALSIRADVRTSDLLSLVDPKNIMANPQVRSYLNVAGWTPPSKENALLKTGQMLLVQEKM